MNTVSICLHLKKSKTFGKNTGQYNFQDKPAPERNAMDSEALRTLFTNENLQEIFPPERADAFFDALFGDPKEGAYDIKLVYSGADERTISMELQLMERPGHCLACNLTQGLPTVFSRHPIINIAGIVKEVDKMLAGRARCVDWSLGYTQQKTRNLHAIPLTIILEKN